MANDSRVKLVKEFVRLWPREVFNMKRGKKYNEELKNLLRKPGVYILYREDVPYYVGQAVNLFTRLKVHAMKPESKRFNFWTHFSIYFVQKRYIDDIESILINAMPSVANDSKPKQLRMKLPKEIKDALLDLKRIPLESMEE